MEQFAAAVHAAGLRLGFYYSGRDWYNPYYLTDQHYRYLEYYFGQVSELLTRYGQVDVLWFDSLGNSSLNQWDPRTMIRRIKQYQPDILIKDVYKRQENRPPQSAPAPAGKTWPPGCGKDAEKRPSTGRNPVPPSCSILFFS